MRLNNVKAIIFLFTLISCGKIAIPLNSNLPTNKSLVIVKGDEAALYFLKEDILAQLQKEIVSNGRDARRIDSLYQLMKNTVFDTLSFPIFFQKITDSNKKNFHSTSFIWITPLMNQGKVWALSMKSNKFGNKMFRRKMRKNKLFYLSTGELLYMTPNSLY